MLRAVNKLTRRSQVLCTFTRLFLSEKVTLLNVQIFNLCASSVFHYLGSEFEFPDLLYVHRDIVILPLEVNRRKLLIEIYFVRRIFCWPITICYLDIFKKTIAKALTCVWVVHPIKILYPIENTCNSHNKFRLSNENINKVAYDMNTDVHKSCSTYLVRAAFDCIMSLK